MSASTFRCDTCSWGSRSVRMAERHEDQNPGHDVGEYEPELTGGTPMIDTPRDDVTPDDLRRRLVAALWAAQYSVPSPSSLSPGTIGQREALRLVERRADALLPVVAEHTAREVLAARAEQREQIVAGLLNSTGDPMLASLHPAIRAEAMRSAADIVREMG